MKWPIVKRLAMGCGPVLVDPSIDFFAGEEQFASHAADRQGTLGNEVVDLAFLTLSREATSRVVRKALSMTFCSASRQLNIK